MGKSQTCTRLQSCHVVAMQWFMGQWFMKSSLQLFMGALHQHHHYAEVSIGPDFSTFVPHPSLSKQVFIPQYQSWWASDMHKRKGAIRHCLTCLHSQQTFKLSPYMKTFFFSQIFSLLCSDAYLGLSLQRWSTMGDDYQQQKKKQQFLLLQCFLALVVQSTCQALTHPLYSKGCNHWLKSS